MTYYKCGSIHPTQNSNVVVDTASGAVANFQTPLAMPLLKTRFDFKAAQDLHGQSGAYPAGGGVNKFDKDTMVVSGYYIADTDGQAKPDSGSSCTDYVEINPNTSYYIKTEQTVGQWAAWYDENKDYISGFNMYNRAVTSPSTAKYIRLTILRSGSGNVDTFCINYPATDTAYHPYSNICPIDGVSEINAVRCRKNLFNLDYLTASGITIQNGEVSGTAQAFSVSFGANAKGLKNKVKFKANTQYTLKFKAYTDANAETQYVGLKVYFWYTDGNTASVSCPNNTLSYTDFSVSSHANKTIDYISISYSNGWANTWHLKDIQLEEGSTATDFEPYNGSTTLINLGGTYYGGYVTQDKDGKRELVVTHDVKLFSELDFRRSNSSGSWSSYVFFAQISDKTNKSAVKCSNYDYVTQSIASMQNKTITSGSSNEYIYIRDDNYTTVEAFKTANANTQVWYELAEPFTVALPDGQPIKSFHGINNIFADTGDTSLQFRKIG